MHLFTAFIEKDETDFHAFVPALRGCHSFGRTVEEATVHITEAAMLHIRCMYEDGEAIPVEDRNAIQLLRQPKEMIAKVIKIT
jgi:predicted RNase H-like HicB family nuclease